MGPSASPAAFSFVHLTDMHLMAGGKWKDPWDGWEYDTEASLRRVIDAVNSLEPRPAFAVLGGDLASPDLLDPRRVWNPGEYEPSYRLLRELVRALPCPAHSILGNHDDRTAFDRVFAEGGARPEGPRDYAFDHQGWHFVMLESLVPGLAGGRLSASQLAWLRADLDAARGRPTLVFVHHPPWPVGLAWIDAARLENGDELMAVLGDHAAVRAVVSGHVHTDSLVQRDGLTLLTTPSTGVQLSKVSQTPKLLPGPPGFRLFRIQGDALTTRVFHLAEGGSSAL